MKQGLLVCRSKTGKTKNVGDYVQSIAAEQFMTANDLVYIQREELNQYSDEKTALIMNAWYMHYPENWPPSDKIQPLMLSMHISPSTNEKMFTSQGIAYFKKHQPIGTRDKATKRLLEKHGIEAYFSGCLTLTLGNTYKNNSESTNIRFVDPYYEVPKGFINVLKYVKNLFFNFSTIKNIALNAFESAEFRKLMRASSFHLAYNNVFENKVLSKAEFMTHKAIEKEIGGDNEDMKLDYARDFLHKYADSQLVVTSRVHVALPCLAMGTPVLFVMSDHYRKKRTSSGRFEGIIELFNVLEYRDLKLFPSLGFKVKDKIRFGKRVKNKNDYKPIAQELEQKCKEFIQQLKKYE